MNFLEKQNLSSFELKDPITETETSVSYLGVELKKAENTESPYVPKKEQYSDYINDSEIALPLQRDVAIAFLQGEPMLIEGGTSLGKTTTIKKMASQLCYEIHYANLNGATDIEDLMGRYIPNPKRSKQEDPEYVFADGRVTEGLRQEEGKIKVIVLDEFNAAMPNILIRLHEVLDALERDGEVILSEDASEQIKVDSSKTKVVALMNPPGKGYLGKEPLDPAQLRRWVYKKMPSELPEETFSLATDSLFGVESDESIDTSLQKMFIKPREDNLTKEQLQEIPGIREILEKYKEFHKAAKILLANRKIAEDQPQLFTYDDRMEPRRVRDFIKQFYNGDINETFKQALGYYYLNKLESDEDKAKLNELINLVEYNPDSSSSKRKGLEETKKAESKEERFAKFEERALDYMERFLEDGGVDKDFIAAGLAGFDSVRAWKIRDNLIWEGVSKDMIAQGLTGLDSERAWKMRDDLIKKGVSEADVARGLIGDYITFVWRMKD